MHNQTRRAFSLATLGATAAFAARTAFSQTGRVRRLIVPFTAGASTDVIARIVAEEFGKRINETIIVENRPGSGGIVAAEYVLRQPADGRTIFLGSTASLAVSKSLYRKLPYDPETDFAALTLGYTGGNFLIVPLESSYRSVADVIAGARANPGKLTYGSPGNGTAGHLIGAMFQKVTNTVLTHVPYKGQNQVMTDLMGGHIALSFEIVGSAMPLILSGKVRALAGSGESRHPLLPSVPTFKEAGVDQLDAFITWGMFVVAKGTPSLEVAHLSEAMRTALDASRTKLEAMGNKVSPKSSQASQQMISEEVRRWAPLVEASGAIAD